VPKSLSLPPEIEGLQTRELFARELPFAPASINEEQRSFEAVVSTETRAMIFDYRNYEVIEEILVARGGQFPARVPLLPNHNRYSVTDVIGSALDFRVENNQWVGRGVLASPADPNDPVERIWKRVAEGHLRAVSIGYRVLEYTNIPPGKRAVVGEREFAAGDRTLRVTTAWRVHELSLTPIGADSEALIRSFHGHSPVPQRSFFAK
jgi:hypothetical protein